MKALLRSHRLTESRLSSDSQKRRLSHFSKNFVTFRLHVIASYEPSIGRKCDRVRRKIFDGRLCRPAWVIRRNAVKGKPKPAKEDVQKVPTLKEFALRFLDGYAKANRLKPSGIASKETVLRVHLARAFGDKRLDEISTEDVQRLKAALTERAPKTVNNVLTVLSVMLRTAVEWGVVARVPCSIKLLKAPKNEASFHDFDEFERLVEAARSEALALLVVLLGGEAGLRCGEIMALEWTDVDFGKRQLTVARSEPREWI